MRIEPFAKIKGTRQDGAIYNGYLFSFNHQGECSVYKLSDLEKSKTDEAVPFCEFRLDNADLIAPHSNAVVFGCEFFDDADEFPLLYTNIYNNYANEENKLKGVCLVYRLQKEENTIKSTLVQMIEIGFVEDETLWRSSGDDARPFGNFVIDTENGIYYAYTMRDEAKTTRYFAFNLPKVNQGEICEKYNIPRVVLSKEDICHYFDVDYHLFVQGGCCHEGKIYSLEGFDSSVDLPPAIRIVDTKTKELITFQKFDDFNINTEPELITFENGVCYYSDHHGNMYKLFF